MDAEQLAFSLLWVGTNHRRKLPYASNFIVACNFVTARFSTLGRRYASVCPRNVRNLGKMGRNYFEVCLEGAEDHDDSALSGKCFIEVLPDFFMQSCLVSDKEGSAWQSAVIYFLFKIPKYSACISTGQAPTKQSQRASRFSPPPLTPQTYFLNDICSSVQLQRSVEFTICCTALFRLLLN